jgi:hypothetical protein
MTATKQNQAFSPEKISTLLVASGPVMPEAMAVGGTLTLNNGRVLELIHTRDGIPAFRARQRGGLAELWTTCLDRPGVFLCCGGWPRYFDRSQNYTNLIRRAAYAQDAMAAALKAYREGRI